MFTVKPNPWKLENFVNSRISMNNLGLVQDENVMVGREGTVTLLDLGSATYETNSKTRSPASGHGLL